MTVPSPADPASSGPTSAGPMSARPGAGPLERLAGVLGPGRAEELRSDLAGMAEALGDGTLWHVNSTRTGGGVAEMLPFLLRYLRAAGIDARWAVITGNPDFFAITKRLHNAIHGNPGDGGPLGESERRAYDEVTAANTEEVCREVAEGDVVVLHDPQTAGLVEPLQAAGAAVVWRCHIGRDRSNQYVEPAWRFLRPLVESADGFVFSRKAHVPDWVPAGRLTIIPPSIDPLSVKNQPLEEAVVVSILARTGILDETPDQARFRRSGGSLEHVRSETELVRSHGVPGADVPMIVQISRWDRLKDMEGVLAAFASGVDGDSHLTLAGPSVEGVTDDPEGREVLMECAEAWDRLPPGLQSRIHLVCLPVEDVEENAVIVNALQRHATVVTQKSLQEGFGLTVTEAMWKSRPIVASAVGGIQDQIVDGEYGLLMADPTDRDAFARAVTRLLGDPETAGRLGRAAHRRVSSSFLPDRHLRDYAGLVRELAGRSDPTVSELSTSV